MPLSSFTAVRDGASFAEAHQQQRHMLLVYTSADCVMCKRVYPALEGMRVQDQFSRVAFAVCSVDGAVGEALLAELHSIEVLPTCILFQGASEIDRVVGCTHKRPGKPIYDMLSKALLRAPSD